MQQFTIINLDHDIALVKELQESGMRIALSGDGRFDSRGRLLGHSCGIGIGFLPWFGKIVSFNFDLY